MDLHESLRTLVSQLGSDIVTDADGFRGALDDYLDEDSANVGDINLLVDAVRLGALQRLLMMIDHGAEHTAAVASAGDSLARDRGSDDSNRSRWACAALAYAVGTVDEAEVLRYQTRPRTMPGMPIGTDEPPVGSTAVVSQDLQMGPEAEALPPPADPTVTAEPGMPSATGTHEPARRRRTSLWVSGSVLVTILGVVLVWIWLDQPDETSAANPGAQDTSPTNESPDGPGLPENVIVAQTISGYPTLDRIITFNVDTGKEADLANGTDPHLSPDRTSVAYLKSATGGSARPYLLSIGTGKSRPLVPAGSDCSYSDEPAFSPAGDRLALVCERADGVALGLFVVNLEGEVLSEVATTSTPFGAPTWISDTTIVYAQRGADAKTPTTLWSINEDGTDEQQLTNRSNRWDSNPDWSESRQLLLFERSSKIGLRGEVWVMVPGGRESLLLLSFQASQPVWSPSGEQFAVLKLGRTVLDITIMITPTDNPFQAVRAPSQKSVYTAPDWGSP